MIKVFYDGKCSVCAKEINFYKKIAKENTVEWVDLTQDESEFQKMGYSKSEGLMYMHVQNSKGDMQIGVNAFITMWKELGGMWRFLAFFIALPIIKQLTSLAYLAFAKYRFKKMGYHCEL